MDSAIRNKDYAFHWTFSHANIALLNLAACVCSGLCPDDWKRYRCSCFLVSSERKTWTESRDDCAHLVVIDSREKQVSNHTDNQITTQITK
uniref:Uncharacterized protein n=1 Tax=Neogobius melanostomus TaxID=47308 RepID=A0A8C6TYP6_9GOBI